MCYHMSFHVALHIESFVTDVADPWFLSRVQDLVPLKDLLCRETLVTDHAQEPLLVQHRLWQMHPLMGL